MLKNKKILIIVTGGISAYKINYLVRDFIKSNAEIKVVLTPTATQFVSPLTLSTLAQGNVFVDFSKDNHSWNNHIELALWADAILVAPCTANTLSKMVNGQCDNLALAVYLSAKCPVFIAPAMDLDMYAHPSTQQNLEKAIAFGHIIIPAEYGELASGLIGQGRLAELNTIKHYLERYFERQKSLSGKTILITAGPTYEAIDPVRFIGNHSSGKMGYAIAKESAERGAKVILISGPSYQKIKHQNIEIHKITSASEMFEKVFQFYHSVDIAIASAAVADYTPKIVSKEKIKKNNETFIIELIKNPDILKTMGEQKEHQFLVGFALETENEQENAKIKLHRKNLDMIVLNSLKDEGAGFQEDTNKIRILTKSENQAFELKSKEAVASDILDFIETKIL